MNQRLRNQEVTAKPRITVNGGSFKVEWWGKVTDQHCVIGVATFGLAVQLATSMARGNRDKVEEINDQQRNNRHARILRRHLIAAVGVDPLNVDSVVAA